MTSILSQTRQDIVELQKQMHDVVARCVKAEAVAAKAWERVRELEGKLNDNS